MLFLSFLIVDLISFGQGSSYSRYTDVVPAGGHTVTFHCCSNPQLCQVISVSTGGSAVNLRGNTYTLTYDSLPDKFQWDVYCNFSQLTLTNPNQVTIFGVQPLVNWPAADTFVIHFVVLLNNGSKVLWYNYVSPQVSISGVVPGNTTFTGIVTLADSALYTNPPLVSGTPDRSKILGVSSTSTAISRFCALLCTDSSEFWNIHGNLGLGGLGRFIGMNDTADLKFKLNGSNAGFISSVSSNTAYGYQSLIAPASLAGNTAIGNQALKADAGGNLNTALGASSIYQNTSGNNNTGIGSFAMQTNTTGSSNTCIGASSDATTAALSNITALGYNAKVSGAFGIAIGSSATAVSNQCTLNGVRSLNMPSIQSSGVGYVLTDSTGLGNFVAAVPTGNDISTLTPVTGDSVTVSAAKNTVNSAGTIANFTLILPASPKVGQVYEFSFLQTVSSLHWSIRLSGGTVSAGITSAASTQYATIKIYYNPTLTQWVLY